METCRQSDSPIVLDGKEVGRVTSSARAEEGVLVLGYVRAEVPADAELAIGSALARQLH